MKKLLSIILLAVATFAFYSCEEVEDPFYSGVAIYMSKAYFYPLDEGAAGKITISDESITTLTTTPASLGPLTLSGGEVNYVFTKANLGISEIGQSTTITLTAAVDGGNASRNFNIAVRDPFVFEGATNFGPVDTTLYLDYEIEDDCTAPTSITVETWFNGDAPVALAGPFDLSAGSIPMTFGESNAFDTLKVRFTASNANGTYVYNHKLILVTKMDWAFDEFDDFAQTFGEWTQEDNDGLPTYTVSAFDFPIAGYTGSFFIMNPSQVDGSPSEAWNAKSGDKYACCMAAVPSGAQGNDDWMISPKRYIQAGYKVNFYAKSITDAYGLEQMIVKVRDLSDNSETVISAGASVSVPTDWTFYEYDLSAFEGKNVSIMIGMVSYDTFALFVDDFNIVTPSGKKVYQNDFETGSVCTETKVK